MKLNHLSLSVPDVPATAAFMGKYFGFKIVNAKGNNIISVMEGNNDFVLVLTTLKQGEGPYPTDFHFGFIVDTEAEVFSVFNLLIADGISIPRIPSKIRNSLAFYFHIPGGIMMEVSCFL